MILGLHKRATLFTSGFHCSGLWRRSPPLHLIDGLSQSCPRWQHQQWAAPGNSWRTQLKNQSCLNSLFLFPLGLLKTHHVHCHLIKFLWLAGWQTFVCLHIQQTSEVVFLATCWMLFQYWLHKVLKGNVWLFSCHLAFYLHLLILFS